MDNYILIHYLFKSGVQERTGRTAVESIPQINLASLAQTSFGKAVAEEPAEKLAIKMRAIQSLSQVKSVTCPWKDFTRSCKMRSIWNLAKRALHNKRY